MPGKTRQRYGVVIIVRVFVAILICLCYVLHLRSSIIMRTCLYCLRGFERLRELLLERQRERVNAFFNLKLPR